MASTDVVEYQMMAATDQAASLSLLPCHLNSTILLQILRVATGGGQAFSVYAVYREGQMTFEVSARLAVTRPSQTVVSILHELIEDHAFLESILVPMKRQVDLHFDRQKVWADRVIDGLAGS